MATVDRNAKILPNGMRSINVPVERSELDAAGEAARKAAAHTESVRAELLRAERAETEARNALMRLRQAIARSGLVES